MPSEARRAHQLVIVLGTLCAVLALLLWRAQRPHEPLMLATDVALTSGRGVWDSHPDPDVSRVLQPDLADKLERETPVTSNAWGVRERPYALPKPTGTVRVVLLGDSYVFGLGVAADERCGVLLERRLRAGATAVPVPPVEVLHLGMTSWDIAAEAAFVRRQLSLLQPDLVVHFVVPNDLDDTSGIRGFGTPGRMPPRRPRQGDSLVSLTYAKWALDPQARGLLAWGLDGESRARLDEAGELVEALAGAVAAGRGRYLLVVNWHAYQAVAEEALAARLPEDQVAYLPSSFYRDARYRLSAEDEHWNAAGMEQMSLYLYGLLVERALVPALAPRALPEAGELARRLDAEGEEEARNAAALQERRRALPIASALEIGALTYDTASQIYAGIDREGQVSPYASCVLATAGGGRVRLVGRGLPRPEIDGGTLEVRVDGEPVGRITLAAGAPVDVSFPLPPAARGRPWVAVQLQSNDYAYTGKDLRHLVCLSLEHIAIEP